MRKLLIPLLCLCLVPLAAPVPARASFTTLVYATNVDAGSPSTDLRWDRYIPGSGGPTWPTVVLIHGGYYNSGNRGPQAMAGDLQNAGFLVFAIEYRLAPPHTEMNDPNPPGDGQQDPPSDGRPPQQTNDVQAAIRAARADSRCNGKVIAVGCSNGAAHALWQAITGAVGDDKPDIMVGLSGPYDLDNVDIDANLPLNKIVNYINAACTPGPSGPNCGSAFDTAAKAASPYWQTLIGAAPPCLLWNSATEVIPISEFNNEVTQLTGYGGTIESHVVPGSLHSNAYWLSSYGGSFPTVKDCTIDFINRMLTPAGSPTPTPLPTPAIPGNMSAR